MNTSKEDPNHGRAAVEKTENSGERDAPFATDAAVSHNGPGAQMFGYYIPNDELRNVVVSDFIEQVRFQPNNIKALMKTAFKLGMSVGVRTATVPPAPAKAPRLPLAESHVITLHNRTFNTGESFTVMAIKLARLVEKEHGIE